MEKNFIITLVLNAMLTTNSNVQLEASAIQRMDYETFELIFYHIFHIYDANKCQRVFQYCYPARDRDQRKCFTQETIDWLKLMNIPNVKIIPGHIQALGGIHFRKILLAFIIFVLKFEMKKIRRRVGAIGASQDVENDATAETLLANYERGQEELLRKTDNYHLVCKAARERHESLHDKINCAETYWKYLCINLNGQELPVIRTSAVLLFRSLDVKM